MRTPPQHIKPTKHNQRKLERAIEAAKKAKQKEAALIEKYERQIAKEREKNNRTQQKMFSDQTPTAVPSSAAATPVAPAAMPKKPVKTAPAPIPAPAFEDEEDEEEEKRRGGIFFTIAGIIFLLIAVGMLLWQFGFLDKILQKPISVPETSSVSVVAEESL